ncbi:hypothetical protein Droror1_Dr00008011 [Drosera rotundifolia]
MDTSILYFFPFSPTRLCFLLFSGLGEELDGDDEAALGFILGAVAAAAEFGEEFLGDVVHPQKHEDRSWLLCDETDDALFDDSGGGDSIEHGENPMSGNGFESEDSLMVPMMCDEGFDLMVEKEKGFLPREDYESSLSSIDLGDEIWEREMACTDGTWELGLEDEIQIYRDS